MIKQLRVCSGKGFDPYYNLALEKYLLDQVAPGECILYLWQNQNTVVIGRNQNAWAECRTGLLEEEGGHLARRLSGGGAVFHDLGNLNFTFLVNEEDYDIERQLLVIQKACALAGIAAEKSGRNDVLAEGRKFSGNAFYHSNGKAYHHGTLLINANMEKLQRYLSPSKAKLEAKGVSSVRSRVVNLQELCPTLTCETMRENMVRSFEAVYGAESSEIALSDSALNSVEILAKEYSSWEYLYGAPLSFSFQCDGRFQWGGIQIQLEAKGGVITGAKVYSDAMDWSLPNAIENALTDCRFAKADMICAIQIGLQNTDIAKDLCELLKIQDI